jgi:hypothetical protein
MKNSNSTTYLMNSLPGSLMPKAGETMTITGLTQEQVFAFCVEKNTKRLSPEVVSAIGDDTVSVLLSAKLGAFIPANCINVVPQKGDTLIIAQFTSPRQLAEGEGYTEEEILNFQINWQGIKY